MHSKSRFKNTNTALPMIVKGLAISLLVTAIMVCVCAKIVEAAAIPEDKMCNFAIASLGLSIAAGVAATPTKEKCPYVSLMVGFCYTAVLLAITALLFGGQYQYVGIKLISILIGSALGILLKFSCNTRKRRRRTKIPRR